MAKHVVITGWEWRARPRWWKRFVAPGPPLPPAPSSGPHNPDAAVRETKQTGPSISRRGRGGALLREPCNSIVRIDHLAADFPGQADRSPQPGRSRSPRSPRTYTTFLCLSARRSSAAAGRRLARIVNVAARVARSSARGMAAYGPASKGPVAGPPGPSRGSQRRGDSGKRGVPFVIDYAGESERRWPNANHDGGRSRAELADNPVARVDRERADLGRADSVYGRGLTQGVSPRPRRLATTGRSHG